MRTLQQLAGGPLETKIPYQVPYSLSSAAETLVQMLVPRLLHEV